jgi:hypothetical protein
MASKAGDPGPARRAARVGKPEARRCAQCGQSKQLRNFPYVYADGEPPGVCRRCLWAAKLAADEAGVRPVPVLVADPPVLVSAPAPVVDEPTLPVSEPPLSDPPPLPDPLPPDVLPPDPLTPRPVVSPPPKVDRWPAALRACGAPSDDLAELMRRQGGVCACCGCPFGARKPRIHRDRSQPDQDSFCAILCHRCLSALGMLNNEVRLVARAADYLRSVSAADADPCVTTPVPPATGASWRVLTPGMVVCVPVVSWWVRVRSRFVSWWMSGRP